MYNKEALFVTKEVVCIKEKKIDLTVTNSRISAILRSNTTKTGIRLYDGSCIGIAGAIGTYIDEELTANAKRMLSFKLPYPAKPAEGVKRTLDLSTKLGIKDDEFVKMSGDILDALSKRFPNFMFSNKITMSETETSLRNDLGTDLVQKDKYVTFELLTKHRDSTNLFDDFTVYINREMEYEAAMKEHSKKYEAYEELVDFSEEAEKVPVILLGAHEEFVSKFMNDMRGDVFATGASLFSGKLGEKLFNDKFSLIVNRDAEKSFSTFFDGEGVVLPDDKFTLIENGVLKAPFTSKRIAKQYNLQETGSALLEYDSAPDATPMSLRIAKSDKTIKELLGGRKAIFVSMASGGDFTSQGEYASPIQRAYLFDGEKFLGRLPQLSMSSNVYDMFGKDFIGVSSDGNYLGSPYSYMVCEMNVQKTDG
jgi:PmbA protein